MKCKFTIIFLFIFFQAIGQEPEHLISIRNQRMLANILKNDNTPTSISLLKGKINSLPKTKAGLSEARQYINDYMKYSSERVMRLDATFTVLETLKETSIQSLPLVKAGSLLTSAAWVINIGKAGEAIKAVSGAIPDYFKDKISNVMDPATLRDNTSKFYMTEFDEALQVFDNYADEVRKQQMLDNLKNPYFKGEAKKAFNNPLNQVAPKISFEVAESKIKNLDNAVQENNESNIELYSKIIFTNEKSLITAQKTQKEIKDIKLKIDVIQQDLRNIGTKTDQILQKQEELQSLTEKLNISIDLGFKSTNKRFDEVDKKLTDLSDPVLQAILKDDIGIGDKIKYLERLKTDVSNNTRKNIYSSIGEIDEKINQYKNERERLEIAKYCSIADKAISYGQVGLAAMAKFNIGSEKDRKLISNLITITQGATAIAKAYGGDPSALISFAMGFLSKPTPSPEMQMLKQIDERIANLEKTVEKGFENLNENLVKVHTDLVDRINFINDQLVDIRQDMAKNHYETIVALSDIKNTLSIIESQNKAIDTKLTKLFLVDIYACEGPYNTFTGKEQTNTLTATRSKMNDYYADPSLINSFIKGQNCQPCLDGLLKFASTDFTSSLSGVFDYQLTTNNLNLGVDLNQIYLKPDLYKKLLSLWTRRFKSTQELNIGVMAMIYPALNASNVTGIFDGFKKSSLQLNDKLSFTNTFQSQAYINSQSVIDMANYYYEFYSILELYDQSKGQILNNIGDVRANKDLILFRNNRLKNALSNVLVMIDRALAQESLISGQMLFDTFVEILKQPNNPESNVVFKALRSSPELAQNFASYLISTTIKTNEVFNSNLKKYDNREIKSISFEKLIDNEISSFFYLKSNENGLTLAIQKQYENRDINNSIVSANPLVTEQLDIPLIKELRSENDANGTPYLNEVYVIDRFLPTQSFFELLNVREKINSILAHRNELDNMDLNRKNNSISPKDLDFLLYQDALQENKSKIYSNSSSNAICEGQEIILSTEANQYNYKWFKNGTLLTEGVDKITVKQAGNYQVSYSNVQNSNANLPISDSVSVNVNSNPRILLPPVVETSNSYYTFSGSFVSGGTPGYIYNWISTPIVNGNGSTLQNPQFGPISQKTIITLQVKDTNGCIATSQTEINPIQCDINISISGNTLLCGKKDVNILSNQIGGSGSFQYQWYKDNIQLANNSPNITISNSGTYYLSVKDSKGCVGKSNSLTVRQIDNLEVKILGENSFCIDGNLDLQVSTTNQEPATFDWYLDGKLILSNSKSLKATSKGSYEVVMSIDKTCTTTSPRFDVIIKGLKAVLEVSGSTNILPHESVTLIANRDYYAQYTWYKDQSLLNTGNSYTDNIKVNKSGEYYFKLLKDGCTTISNTVKVTVQEPLSVEDESKIVSINIFPNPTTNQIFIGVNNNVEKGDLELTRLDGTIVFQKTNALFNNYFEFKNLIGVHLLKISINGKVYVSKVIFQ